MRQRCAKRIETLKARHPVAPGVALTSKANVIDCGTAVTCLCKHIRADAGVSRKEWSECAGA